MKYYSLIFLLIGLPTISLFSVIGKNNMTISLGGGLNYNAITPNDNTLSVPQQLGETFIGGGYAVELGHLYLSNPQTQIIHSIHTRLTFSQNFNNINTIAGQRTDLTLSHDNINLKIGTVYQLGIKQNSGYLMLDIVGFDLGWSSGNMTAQLEALGKFAIVLQNGNSALIGINLPLGINYIMNNGFMIGFRHQIGFLLGTKPSSNSFTLKDSTVTIKPNDGSVFGTSQTQSSYIDYTLTFHIGYTFGK